MPEVSENTAGATWLEALKRELAAERSKSDEAEAAMKIGIDDALERGTTGVLVIEVHLVCGRITKVRRKLDETVLEDSGIRR